MKTLITRKTQLKISALSKNVPDTYFYEVRNWNRGSQFQNEVISHATPKKRKNSHDTMKILNALFASDNKIQRCSFGMYTKRTTLHFVVGNEQRFSMSLGTNNALRIFMVLSETKSALVIKNFSTLLPIYSLKF